jgi:hypothetical protein
MKKATSINRGKFLGAYCDDARNERIPDQVLFAIGALFWLGLPQVICGIYGGTVSLIALAGSASVGIMWGRVMYGRQPERLSIYGTRRAAQSPPRKDNTMKRAA